MDCEGTRTKGAWNRFFESLFKKNKENEGDDKKGKVQDDSTAEGDDGKVKKFFKKLFKKND